jgi:uncharacterized protein YbgA (DUF1722 family)/uncharacterized protein YbbK (DUF523 family)
LNNTSPDSTERVRIGISSCLPGERVRFDGGHKKDEFLTSHFGRFVQWVPFCPEIEMGLGIPRESLRLVDNGDGLRLIAPRSGLDYTHRMRSLSELQTDLIAANDLCGYVLKRSSPSCGLERVKVYRGSGLLHRQGRGLFAAELIKHFPNLPMEEEGRLNDPRLRENFVSQVFCYKRWTDLQKQGLTRAAIVDFHAAHKFLLLAHHQAGTRDLGALLGQSGRSTPARKLGQEYFDKLCEVMRHTPTRRNHTNVLQHMAGYFKTELVPDDRAELADLIERYRRNLLPLIVPITLLRHYIRKLGVRYLQDQIYLNPPS